MTFDPGNNVIKLCLQGMEMEKKGNMEEASSAFLRAWNEATNDFEKFTASYYVARRQKDVRGKLKWYETALEFAHKVNDDAVKGSFSLLHSSLADCYDELGDLANAKKNHDLAATFNMTPSDTGPFYHGTKADLKMGDLLTAGAVSNYDSKVIMNHIYFTALVNGAGLAAELAKGEGNGHVYIVEPTGSFENDPNVTNKKFPGNPTRSYRSKDPLKIIGEVKDWVRLTPQELQQWREKLAKIEGKIIN